MRIVLGVSIIIALVVVIVLNVQFHCSSKLAKLGFNTEQTCRFERKK